jgi:hypothetical protein
MGLFEATNVVGIAMGSTIFKVKNTFEPNVLKLVIIYFFISSNPFSLLISMLKSSPIFKRNGAHLVEKKNI